MTGRLVQLTRPWLTEAGCLAAGGHLPEPTEAGTSCAACGVTLPHHLTVTVGPVGCAVGRAWFECTCGIEAAYPTKRAATGAALHHFGEVYGAEARDRLVERAMTAGTR